MEYRRDAGLGRLRLDENRSGWNTIRSVGQVINYFEFRHSDFELALSLKHSADSFVEQESKLNPLDEVGRELDGRCHRSRCI